MANWKKILVGTGIGAGIVGIITYVTRDITGDVWVYKPSIYAFFVKDNIN